MLSLDEPSNELLCHWGLSEYISIDQQWLEEELGRPLAEDEYLKVGRCIRVQMQGT